MEVAIAYVALETLPDAPSFGANRVEPRLERGILSSVQCRDPLIEARARVAANGVGPHGFHDPGHVGLVAVALFGRPQLDIRGRTNGGEHLIHQLA